MKVEKFVEIVGADFFTGVPDSQLKALANWCLATYGEDPKHHVIAARKRRGVGGGLPFGDGENAGGLFAEQR